MTITEIKKQIAGLTKEQREKKAISLLTEFADESKAMSSILAQNDVNIDLLKNTAWLLVSAIASDGVLDRSEYSTYTKLCKAMGVEAETYEACQYYIRIPAQVLDLCEQMANALRTVYSALHRNECYSKLAVAVACLLTEDDEFAGNELQMLSFLADDDANGSINADGQLHSASNQTENVVLVNYHASFARGDDEFYISFGAELKNPNKQHCARNVNVKVIVKDASGRILASSENTIDYIDSNATFYYGDEFSIERGTPDNYTVQVNCDDFVEAPEDSAFASGITCSHYNLDSNRWGDTVFSGNVHNGYKKELWIDLYFVFFDSAKKITGGTKTSVVLYGNSDDTFDTNLYVHAPRDSVRFSPAFDFMELVD